MGCWYELVERFLAEFLVNAPRRAPLADTRTSQWLMNWQSSLHFWLEDVVAVVIAPGAMYCSCWRCAPAVLQKGSKSSCKHGQRGCPDLRGAVTVL